MPRTRRPGRRRRRHITGKIPLTGLAKDIHDQRKYYKKFTNEELILHTLAELVKAADFYSIGHATREALSSELYSRKSNE